MSIPVQARDERTQNKCSRTVVFCSVLQNRTEQNMRFFFRPELECMKIMYEIHGRDFLKFMGHDFFQKWPRFDLDREFLNNKVAVKVGPGILKSSWPRILFDRRIVPEYKSKTRFFLNEVLAIPEYENVPTWNFQCNWGEFFVVSFYVFKSSKT